MNVNGNQLNFKVVKWGWKEGDCHFKFKTFKLSEC